MEEVIEDTKENSTDENINQLLEPQPEWVEDIMYNNILLIVNWSSGDILNPRSRNKKVIGNWHFIDDEAKNYFNIIFEDYNIEKKKGYIKDKGLEIIIKKKVVTKNKKATSKKEVQEHGFFWEKHILRNCFNITEDNLKSIGYTAKHDLPKELNTEGFNISCKCSKSLNDVNMGDPIRLFDAVNNKDDSIHLIIFFWKQYKGTKKVIKNYEIDITDQKDLLFGKITKDDLETLRNIVCKIPTKSKPSPEQHKTMYDLRNKLHEKKGALRLDIKCNSQQSRIQCTIHKFTEFIVEHSNLVISSNETNEFRGKSIPDFHGGARVFNKKI